MPLTPTRYYSARAIKPVWQPELGVSFEGTLPASIVYLKGQVLGEKIGASATFTLTITGTPTGGTFTITYGGQTTAGIAYNAQPSAVATALNALTTIASNTIQTWTVNGSPTGGTFTVGILDQVSVPIVYNATAAVVQTAIGNLANIGSGNVSVSGSTGGPWTITFNGALAGSYVPAASFNYQSLTGGTAPTVTAVETNPGGGNSINVACTGTQLPGGTVTITFQNRLGNQSITTPTTTSSGLTGGTTPTASIAAGTAGSAGTAGAYAAYNINNTDGSQVAKGILQFDCATDANGNITLGYQSGGGPWSETFLTAPIWLGGYFAMEECIGLTAQAISDMGRIVQGSLANGGVFWVGGA